MVIARQTKIILLIGLLISGSIFYLIWNKQKGNWETGFQNKAQVLNLAFLSRFELNEKVLESLIALFRSSNFVSREEFGLFSETIIKNKSYIHALEWIPKVPHAKRKEFEDLAKSDGLSDFQFSELSDSGKMISAKKREVYFPVYYVNPLERNKMALGFDLYSNSIRRETLEKSLEGGNVEGSSQITLVQKDKSGPGFLIFYPLYRGNQVPETPQKRREMFEGFVLGVYLIKELIEDVLHEKMAPGLNLAIYEGTQIDEKNRLYGDLMTHPAMELSSQVNVSGRSWLLVWQANDQFKGGLGYKFPLVASGGVFALIFLLAIIFEMNLMKTKIIEKEVRIRTAELKRANSDLEKFASVASHDLKAPLRGISHLSSWIKDDLGENIPDPVRKNLDRLSETVINMDALIKGILDYSKAGKSLFELKTVRVDSLIKEILDIPGLGDEVAVEIQPGLPVIQTDLIKLKQVFLNLISNAIKHNKSPNKKLVISSKKNGKFYEFRIADNGPGIEPKYHEKIFQMFETLRPKSENENTGVGLPIVKKLVDEVNGSIKVESLEGGGAAFVFLWPINIENID